jgi:hypothetical protein
VILIIGGNARSVGKTTLVCQIIAATVERQWIAVKISGHPHGSPPLERSKRRATELFAEAGAAETHLLRETPEHRALLDSLVASGRNTIIESNRAAVWYPDGRYLFILDEQAADPKPRERWHLDRAARCLPPRQDVSGELLAWVSRQA